MTVEKRNYCQKDGTCSATCLEETKACLFSEPSKMNGLACTYCDRDLVCKSPKALKEADRS